MSRVLPILFNTDMVQAILDGRKTETRRLIKLQSSGDWCTVRELPEKKESDCVMDHDIDFGMTEGWNACIDAIKGEREEK